jgi:hypothetical protein
MAEKIYTYNHFKSAWLEELKKKYFRNLLAGTLILLAIALFFLAKFLAYNEIRQGFSFNDPLLSKFTPIDVTWLTFVLIYVGLVIALGSLAFYPERMLIALQSYTLVASLRLITIYFLPLSAPHGIIPLKDPFIEFFGGGTTLLRDLFFSGHTATMFLFFLTSPSKRLRPIFLTCTILIGYLVLVQHVHYTIDVLAAPFFAYTSYRISRLLVKRFRKRDKANFVNKPAN